MFPLQNNTDDSKLYVDDVFAVATYTGFGAGGGSVNNGIDLSGKGGMVWEKSRSNAYGHQVVCSDLGVSNILITNSTSAVQTNANYCTSFNSNGYSQGSAGWATNVTLVSWTFRKAAKFFDIVTWSGDGTNSRVLSHSLGIQPGMIVVKRVTGGAENWPVWHRSVSAAGAGNLFLNLANELSGTKIYDADATTFTLATSDTSHNAVGSTYVAYLFAHDTSTDGIIQCGSFTTDSSGSATVNLGWEPQWVLWKIATGGVEDWYVMDSMRGMPVQGYNRLFPNKSSAEDTATATLWCQPNATGFKVSNENPSSTYIYIAIRRPNKPPTSGTSVYNAIAYTGTGTNNREISGVGFPFDALLYSGRSGANGYYLMNRLTGAGRGIWPYSTSAETNYYPTYTPKEFRQDGYVMGDGDSTSKNINGTTYIDHFFRRAVGFFDVVCYTGTNAAQTLTHWLGAIPEFIICKDRTGADAWYCYHADIGNTKYIRLDSTAASSAAGAQWWNNTTPTASSFTIGAAVSTSPDKYVAYLFATLAGISKVGSYTGNGSSQTINCGFSAGARFILIKRTDGTGDWYIWDSVRGVIAANDPHLSLNTTAAEVTTDDSVDPDNSGFIVNQVAATNINVNSATYIYLAVA